MAQLEQWKANHQQGKINQFVNEMNQTNLGAVKNTQGNARSEVKSKYQGKLTNIRAINLNHYTLEISLGNARAPIIHAEGRRNRAEAEEAIAPFKTLYPTAQIRVIRFKEAFLFKQCAGIGLGIDAEQGGKKWLN